MVSLFAEPRMREELISTPKWL